MTPEGFNTLDYTAKTEAVLKSVYLASRRVRKAYVKLYSRDSFYIEVFFDRRSRLITHFRACRQTQLALPYLTGLHMAV